MQKQFEIYQSGKSFFSNKKESIDLSSSSSLGEIKEGKVVYSIYEVLYLLETKKAVLLKGKFQVSFKELSKKADSKVYIAFRDLRNKGYILKEGLKFGSDFRVYNKGDKPGKNHAKYLLYTLSSSEKLKPSDFCARARVAHSTNKILLLAIVDSEEDMNYYEINWKSKE